MTEEQLEELIESYDKNNNDYTIIPEDEIYEETFRFEYAMESISDPFSIFKRILPDS